MSEKAAVSLDSWGLTTPETLEACRERTKKWKPELLKLARQVHEAMLNYQPCPLTKLRALWYIADGTLLGAVRSGEMISHDYDFDYGLFFLTEDGSVAGLEESKQELGKIAKHLTDCLDKKFTVKPRNDYAFKIELYQESSGVHWTNKGDWYNVHMDMQLMYTPDQKKFYMAYFRDNYNDYFAVNVSSVIPLSEIDFEAKKWPCPKDPTDYLKAIYGYIGTPAKYNPTTRKYEPLD